MKKLLLALSLVAVVTVIGCKKEEAPVTPPETPATNAAPAAP